MRFSLLPTLLALAAGSVTAQEAPPPAALRAQLLGPSTEPTVLHRTESEPVTLASRDPWFGFDKVQHFTFSFLITVGSQYTFVNKLSAREGPALPFSVGVGASAGLAKEFYDDRPGGTGFSHRDLVWDALGLGAAVVFILL